MADNIDQFERARREPDPLRRAKMASELITIYQQRGVELARLRREAINRAADERGLSFSSIAAELGLTRGRITQIRQTAPPAERAFFGVGPVTVVFPLRQLRGGHLIRGCSGGRMPDCTTQGSGVPRADIQNPAYESPMDQTRPDMRSDVAYVGRLALPDSDQSMLVIAGVHALGSVGAVDYLTRNLPELYADVGTHRFSMVVASQHDGETVTKSELRRAPRIHA